MKNKNALALAVALSISAMPLIGVAEAGETRGSLYVNGSVGDDVTILADADTYDQFRGHAFGIYANTMNANDLTSAGDRLTIITKGAAADGIRTNPSGDGNWQQAVGKIVIGDGLNLTTSGVSADGINANGSTTVTIGKNATIKTLYDGPHKYPNDTMSDGAHAIRANFHATVNIGDGATISTLGTGSHAVFAAQGRSFKNNPTEGSKINIGKNSAISTVGDDSSAVLLSSNNGKITIGDSANISTSGKQAHGVGAYSFDSAKGGEKGGSVTIGANSAIKTTGEGSYGVYANTPDVVLALGDGVSVATEGEGAHALYSQRGVIETGSGLNLSVKGQNANAAYVDSATASIKFKGGATINMNGSTSAALLADKGKITGEIGTAKYNITGNLSAINGGAIDLKMGNHSIFTGKVEYDATSDVKLGLYDYSVWNIVENSAITNLDVGTKGQVNLSYTAGTSTVVDVENLTGSGGVFKFNTDLNSETNADKLNIKNTDAGSTHYIQVKDASLVNGEVTGKKKVLLVTDESKNATFVGETLDNGGLWDITPTIERGDTLGAGEDEWYLTKVKKKDNDNKKLITAGFASDYSLWRATNDTLRKRLGDVRGGQNGDAGIWARMYHGKLNGPDYDNSYHTYQLGYDKQVKDFIFGAAIEHNKGGISYESGSGDTKFTALNLYATWMGDKGQYADVVLRGGRLGHDMQSYGKYAEHSDYDSNAYSISAEYGKQLDYQKGWFVTPQAQFTLGKISGVDFTTERNTKVKVDGVNSFIGRLGVEVGRQVNKDTNYFFRLGLFHEFAGKRDIAMAAANGDKDKQTYDYGDTWFEIGIGGEMKMGKNSYLYGDIERGLGGDTTKAWQVNAGVRWEF